MWQKTKKWWNKKKKWERRFDIFMCVFLISAFIVYPFNELIANIGIIIGAVMAIICALISDFKKEWIKDEEETMAKNANK